MFHERRRHQRERIALPLQLADGRHGVTRNVSAGGLFFVLEGRHLLRGSVDFELQLVGFRVKFTSRGEIVRLEHAHGVTGVAVHLTDPRLDAVRADEGLSRPRAGHVLPKSGGRDHGQAKAGSR